MRGNKWLNKLFQHNLPSVETFFLLFYFKKGQTVKLNNPKVRSSVYTSTQLSQRRIKNRGKKILCKTGTIVIIIIFFFLDATVTQLY